MGIHILDDIIADRNRVIMQLEEEQANRRYFRDRLVQMLSDLNEPELLFRTEKIYEEVFND